MSQNVTQFSIENTRINQDKYSQNVPKVVLSADGTHFDIILLADGNETPLKLELRIMYLCY